MQAQRGGADDFDIGDWHAFATPGAVPLNILILATLELLFVPALPPLIM